MASAVKHFLSVCRASVENVHRSLCTDIWLASIHDESIPPFNLVHLLSHPTVLPLTIEFIREKAPLPPLHMPSSGATLYGAHKVHLAERPGDNGQQVRVFARSGSLFSVSRGLAYNSQTRIDRGEHDRSCWTDRMYQSISVLWNHLKSVCVRAEDELG